MLQKQWQEHAAGMSGKIVQILDEQRQKKPETPIPIKEVKKESEDADADKPMFPKAVPLVKGKESPDIISEEESDDWEDTEFDTDKLNKTYSIEKIRKLRREQRARERANQFNQVLQKYFRMRNVLKAFTPTSKESQTPGRKLSLSRSKYSGYSAYHLVKPKKKQTKQTLPKLAGKQKVCKKQQEEATEEEEEEEKVTVGKLKHYRFLDASKKSKPTEESRYEERHDAFPMEDFRLNTERALEEFVVRREIFVSDSSTKKSVSVTFTKKSVFVKSKFSCD